MTRWNSEDIENAKRKNPDLAKVNPALKMALPSKAEGVRTQRRKILTRQAETEFLRSVLEHARLTGWRVAHFRGAWSKDGERFITPVQADGKGFFDLVLVRERVIFAECKAQGGKMSEEQLAWQNAMIDANQEVYLWMPNDWEGIVDILNWKRINEAHAIEESRP